MAIQRLSIASGVQVALNTTRDALNGATLAKTCQKRFNLFLLVETKALRRLRQRSTAICPRHVPLKIARRGSNRGQVHSFHWLTFLSTTDVRLHKIYGETSTTKKTTLLDIFTHKQNLAFLQPKALPLEKHNYLQKNAGNVSLGPFELFEEYQLQSLPWYSCSSWPPSRCYLDVVHDQNPSRESLPRVLTIPRRIHADKECRFSLIELPPFCRACRSGRAWPW